MKFNSSWEVVHLFYEVLYLLQGLSGATTAGISILFQCSEFILVAWLSYEYVAFALLGWRSILSNVKHLHAPKQSPSALASW